jgi:hypothetical protein
MFLTTRLLGRDEISPLLRLRRFSSFSLVHSIIYTQHNSTSQETDITHLAKEPSFAIIFPNSTELQTWMYVYSRKKSEHHITSHHITSRYIRRSHLQVFYAYTYGSFCWFALQALPLIVSPTIIITLLSPEVREPTALETYFCRSLGMALLTLGIMVVLLTGSVPLTSSISESRSISLPLPACT